MDKLKFYIIISISFCFLNTYGQVSKRDIYLNLLNDISTSYGINREDLNLLFVLTNVGVASVDFNPKTRERTLYININRIESTIVKDSAVISKRRNWVEEDKKVYRLIPIAHEFSHHLMGHTFATPNVFNEIKADISAGRIIYKLLDKSIRADANYIKHLDTLVQSAIENFTFKGYSPYYLEQSERAKIICSSIKRGNLNGEVRERSNKVEIAKTKRDSLQMVRDTLFKAPYTKYEKPIMDALKMIYRNISTLVAADTILINKANSIEFRNNAICLIKKDTTYSDTCVLAEKLNNYLFDQLRENNNQIQRLSEILTNYVNNLNLLKRAQTGSHLLAETAVSLRKREVLPKTLNNKIDSLLIYANNLTKSSEISNELERDLIAYSMKYKEAAFIDNNYCRDSADFIYRLKPMYGFDIKVQSKANKVIINYQTRNDYLTLNESKDNSTNEFPKFFTYQGEKFFLDINNVLWTISPFFLMEDKTVLINAENNY